MRAIMYKVNPECDHIFDEKGNTFLALRKIQWGENGGEKLDIRKWYTNANGEETVGKGVSFITEDGPHELAKILVENDFGYTEEIIEGIKNRKDFMSSLTKCLNGDIPDSIEVKDTEEEPDGEYFDPSEVLF